MDHGINTRPVLPSQPQVSRQDPLSCRRSLIARIATAVAKLRAPEDVWRRVRLAPGTETRTRPHAIVLPRERLPGTTCLV